MNGPFLWTLPRPVIQIQGSLYALTSDPCLCNAPNPGDRIRAPTATLGSYHDVLVARFALRAHIGHQIIRIGLYNNRAAYCG